MTLQCSERTYNYGKKKRIKPEIITNNIDMMCEIVNEKYGLLPNQRGSIEYHHDASENSIVQIVNKSRGVRHLIHGDDKTLLQYLQNILDDKTVLNFWCI